MKRRQILMSGAAAFLFPAGIRAALSTSPARAAEDRLFPDDRVLGRADAPITMIEYSSLTCPHCAALHREALPKIKETWIAEGRVRLVYRHFPLDGLALRAAALSNCIEGDRFFGFLDLLFKNQKRWSSSQDPLKELGQMARLAGLSQEQTETCLSDEAEMDGILKRAQDGKRSYGIQATPTSIINGRKVEGARAFDDYQTIFREFSSDT